MAKCTRSRCSTGDARGLEGKPQPGGEPSGTRGREEQESPRQKRAGDPQAASEQAPGLPVVTGQQRRGGESRGASLPPARHGDPEGQR